MSAIRSLKRDMVAYKGPQRLILPERLMRLSAPLDLDRSPIRCTCECGRADVICVPNANGQICWTCATCKRSHAIGFKPEAESHGSCDMALQRKPIEHLCQSPGCEQRDCIVLPAGEGELRWTCPGMCGKVWGMRFRKDGQVDLFKVSQ